MKRCLVLLLGLSLTACDPDHPLTLPPPAWGWADLHAHPASHLSFGAHPDGSDDGILWGTPGGALADGERTVLTDLGECDGNMHGGEADPITHRTHEDLIKTLNFITGLAHSPDGPGSDFVGWPHSQSLLHEQMHITAIHRAYQGGLRLMVASVTGNQMLGDRLWLGNHDVPARSIERDSAEHQLAFIQHLVAQNSTWMAIVANPIEARAAIRDGKLAVVLGLEMDSLNAEDMIALSQRYKVRTVIPIHLADNDAFGGSAVYGDLFNANSKFLNGRYFAVEGDPNLQFRLGRPSFLADGPFGSVIPTPISAASACTLGYDACPEIAGQVSIPWRQGMKNARGLNRFEMRRLLERGLIVDLAHMGEKSAADALEMGRQFDYPMLYSHGGIRAAGEPAGNERAFPSNQADQLRDQGGVFGLGTEGNIDPQPLAISTAGHRFAGSEKSFEIDLKQPWVDHFEVTLVTGAAGLFADLRALVVLELAGRAPIEVALTGTPWAAGSTHTISVPLPSPVAVTDVVRAGLRLDPTGKSSWDVASFTLVGVGPTANRLPVFTDGTPPQANALAHLNLQAPTWNHVLRLQPSTEISRVVLRVRNGSTGYLGPIEDPPTPFFSGGGSATATLFLADRTGFDLNLSTGAIWPQLGTQERSFTLPSGTRAGDLAALHLRFAPPNDGRFWQVAGVTVLAQTPGGALTTITEQNETFLLRASDDGRTFSLAPPTLVPLDRLVAAVRLNVDVSDEMDSTGLDISATVRTLSGTSSVGSLNLRGRLRDGGTTRAMILLPPGTHVRDLDRLRIDGPGVDDWEANRIAVDTLSDPVTNWSHEYVQTLARLGGRGLAIGTDINGLAPQVPFTRADVPERITVASARAPSSLAATAPELPTSQLGTTPFRFEERGIAHYGMLPDFLQAVAAQPEGSAALDGLFRSAEDFLVMRDKIIAARDRVLASPDTTPVQQLRVTVTTGDDDLRCDSHAQAFVTLSGGTEVSVDLGSSLGNGSVTVREFALPSSHPMSDLTTFGVRGLLSNGDLSPCAGLSQDNWTIAGARLEFRDPSGSWQTLVDRRDHWLKRMDHADGNQLWTSPL